jgi:hypothetical protein
MPTPIKKKRKKHIQNLKRNKSGRDATVKVEFYPDEPQRNGDRNKIVHYAAPAITFKGNEKARPQSFNEAKKAGELYEFKRRKKAEKFAAGSWKKGKDRKEAMKAYRAKKRQERKNK